MVDTAKGSVLILLSVVLLLTGSLIIDMYETIFHLFVGILAILAGIACLGWAIYLWQVNSYKRPGEGTGAKRP